ncbi:MAG TPA: 30S ribosomal protein S9, partial [Thermoanaerobaculia bacterium]|nr:30S ribosomal protein S9 [Thermoanaerobaculia bacterium]
MTNLQFQAVGRRKESVARVYLRPGKGSVQVNDRTFEDFFPNDVLKMVIRQPLQLTETVDKFDVV